MKPFLFGSVSSYSVLLAVAVIAAVVCFRLLSDRLKTPSDIYNRYSTVGIFAIAVGMLSAFLFQAVYDFVETGEWELSGLTFLGGLVGGAAFFVGLSLGSKKPRIRQAFLPQAEIGAPCVAIAHALGRIGCFLAGCCYGRSSEHGLYFPSLGERVIPTQLYEAIFLFVLFGALIFLTIRRKGISLIVYCYAYGVFRFVIEFFRADPRGAFLGALSPSQVLSIVLIAAAVALTVLRVKKPLWFSARYEDKTASKVSKADKEAASEEGSEQK